MKYIINKETKKHQAVGDAWQLYDKENYYIVEADSEGWIAHTGNECPLPDDERCQAKFYNGESPYGGDVVCATNLDWCTAGVQWQVVAYRPILDAEEYPPQETTQDGVGVNEKVQEPEPHPTEFQKSCVEALQKRFYPEPTAHKNELLDRLKAAHEAQKELPKLLQELRDALGDDLINQLCAVPNSGLGVNVWNAASKVDFSAVKHVDMTQPTEDMTDWRNWREGDLVECVGKGHVFYPYGAIREVVTDFGGDFGVADHDGHVLSCAKFSNPKFNPADFRFHSRPAKGEK